MELVIEGVGKQYQGQHWRLREFSLELGAGVLGLVGSQCPTGCEDRLPGVGNDDLLDETHIGRDVESAERQGCNRWRPVAGSVVDLDLAEQGNCIDSHGGRILWQGFFRRDVFETPE